MYTSISLVLEPDRQVRRNGGHPIEDRASAGNQAITMHLTRNNTAIPRTRQYRIYVRTNEVFSSFQGISLYLSISDPPIADLEETCQSSLYATEGW